ncbi:MAG: hypothetical protein QM709_09735 [Spongiibacteraceae bacterium]
MATKKNISVRLGVADLRRVKEIALRLDVKESEIFRYAVKALSTRLMPLLNRQLSGVPMLVALLESGEELLRYFEFDATQLDRLINAAMPDDQARVDMEDIELLVIAGINRDYLATQLSEKLNARIDGQLSFDALRHYLFRKYRVRAYAESSVA